MTYDELAPLAGIKKVRTAGRSVWSKLLRTDCHAAADGCANFTFKHP